ncbi:MAG: hypothetical protein FWB85_02685 [Chitinispirillia bacterium]|nr:hypothetical protein [Chitinispirillia bacterium]MCL2241330.1 hypothetical protein [Chitinispirillia bacterium]
MPKGIIVVDVPAGCIDCGIRYINLSHEIKCPCAGILDRQVAHITERPSDCPIRVMPEGWLEFLVNQFTSAVKYHKDMRVNKIHWFTQDEIAKYDAQVEFMEDMLDALNTLTKTKRKDI